MTYSVFYRESTHSWLKLTCPYSHPGAGFIFHHHESEE